MQAVLLFGLATTFIMNFDNVIPARAPNPEATVFDKFAHGGSCLAVEVDIGLHLPANIYEM